MSSAAGSDQVQRAEVSYQPLYQRFLIKDRDYKKQYSHIYTRRLAALRPVVLRSAEERWGGQSGGLNVCSKIIDLRAGAASSSTSSAAAEDSSGVQVVVSGCIFKQQQLKPSILDSYRGDRAVTVKDRANFTSDADSLVLEDESGRVILAAGEYSPPASEGGPEAAPGGPWPQPFPLAKLVHALVTGVVVAVLGRVVETGELRVDDACVAGWTRVPGPGESEGSVPEPLPMPRPLPAGEQPVYALLISGLRFASTSAHPMALQLLWQWLSGMTGGDGKGGQAGRVARVIIAGGLLGATPATSTGHGKGSTGAGAGGSKEASFSDRNVAAAESEALAGPIREADAWLCALASCVPVDIMPGALDPCTQSLPQQPLHPILLPSAGRYGSLRCVSNPYDCRLGGVRLLGHSGQPLADVARCAASSHVTQPGDESGMLAEAQGRARGRKSLGGSGSASVGTHASSVSSPPGLGPGLTQGGPDLSLGASQAYGMEGISDAAGPAGDDADAALAGLRTSADDEDEGVGSAEVAAALSGTAGDKALGALATGAGAGFEARAAAGGDGSEVVASLNPLDLLHNTWVWRHMAPTAPDTLPSYPFVAADPFIIESDSFPHVFFAGCQRAFGTRLARGPDTSAVRLITVPNFASTHTAVLLDLTSPTLEATPLSFAVGGLERSGPASSQPAGQGWRHKVVR